MSYVRTGRKLIRDRVPVNDGGQEGPRATGDEYQRLIFTKIVEEAHEAIMALAVSPEQTSEELADVLEAVYAAASTLPGGLLDVTQRRSLKHLERGGFELGRTYWYPEASTA